MRKMYVNLDWIISVSVVKHMRLTETTAWLNLKTHYETMRHVPLNTLFSESPNRFKNFSADAAGLFVDYSKNWINAETVALFSALANERKLPHAISALFSGEKINFSERRRALHTALRLSAHETLLIDGVDLVFEIQQELQKIKKFATQLKQKKLLGFSGKPIESILHVGVGGSILGPALYYQAISHDKKKATCHFLGEFDYVAVQEKLNACNPETTIAVFVSKSFTTQEAVIIFETIKSWLCDAAGDEKKIQSQLFAVTEKTDRAIAAGFLREQIFKMWDWVGGRYSVWSAVNFSAILALGFEYFERFLAGAYQMDLHFQQMPVEKNMPIMMALLAIGYNNFFHAHSKAIVPYSSRLNKLTAYLQQLHMESLGKNVNSRAEKVDYATGRVIWGDVGPGGQHSFHQLFMQGSQFIPVDFILPLSDGNMNDYDIKRAAYCLSQSQTLLQGFNGNVYQNIDGNRPSTTILIDRFTPETLGALLALYEHKVFVKSVIWDINAFDQWGVERGKQVAQELIQCIDDRRHRNQFDSSTEGLLDRIIGRLS